MKRKWRIAMMAVFLTVVCTNAHSAVAHAKPSIVLVHGALIDGSSWRGVHDVLVRHGYPVRVVQQPLTGLEADVAATRRVLDQIEGPIILVGNSYGGSIITVAGADPKVKALVYVAALIPDVGESSSQLAPPKPALAQHFITTADGFASLPPERFAEDFGPELPRDQATFMANAQMPVSLSAFESKVTVAAWHDKPSYFVLATEDQILEPELARWMAKRAGAKVTSVKASHAVLVTKPREVARVIETAARALD